MKLGKLFTPVSSMSPEEVRAFRDAHEEGSYTLLDVRQPHEYEDSHIPGAILIPLPDLLDTLDNLDPEKPTIVYCAIGGRSRVAAQLLSGKGFTEPINLSGGIKAWDGLKAAGPVELNLDLVRADSSLGDVLKVAYGMEHALAEFYRLMQSRSEHGPVADLLGRLASVEEKHKQYLREVYEAISPVHVDTQSLETAASTMEGGFRIEDFVRENEQFTKASSTLLDLAMMLETQALDLYLRFADKMEAEKSRQVLFTIGNEEKGHLRALGRLRDEVSSHEPRD
ncbi:MAG: rhodanese-like domain-containing protein [Thermodesulfobacteriota bacterium]